MLNGLLKAKSLGYKTLTLTERSETSIRYTGDYYLNFICGLEACNAKTKGYRASLLLLHLIAIEIAKRSDKINGLTYQTIRKELVEIVKKIPDVVEQTNTWVENNKDWSKAESLTVISHASNHGTEIESRDYLKQYLIDIVAIAKNISLRVLFRSHEKRTSVSSFISS